jgi:hypothetical protein
MLEGSYTIELVYIMAGNEYLLCLIELLCHSLCHPNPYASPKKALVKPPTL